MRRVGSLARSLLATSVVLVVGAIETPAARAEVPSEPPPRVTDVAWNVEGQSIDVTIDVSHHRAATTIAVFRDGTLVRTGPPVGDQITLGDPGPFPTASPTYAARACYANCTWEAMQGGDAEQTQPGPSRSLRAVPYAETQIRLLCFAGGVIGEPIPCGAAVQLLEFQPDPPTPVIEFGPVTGTGAFSTLDCGYAGSIWRCVAYYTPPAGSAGDHVVSARYGGDDRRGPSEATRTLAVVRRATSASVRCDAAMVGVTSACEVSIADASPGTAIEPAGTVGVSTDGAATVSPASCPLDSTGSCSFTYAPGPGTAGTQTITVAYGGDADHVPVSADVGIEVSRRPTQTSIECSPTTLPARATSACTASVVDAAPGEPVPVVGTVTTDSVHASGGSCTLGPEATCTSDVRPGAVRTVAVEARYLGSRDHAPSSTTTSLTAVRRRTGTTVACSPNPTTPLRATTCTVEVEDADIGYQLAPSGQVSLSATGANGSEDLGSCWLSNLRCAISFVAPTAGTFTLDARYASSTALHEPSTGSTTVEVVPEPTELSLAEASLDLFAAQVHLGGRLSAPNVAPPRSTAVVGRLVQLWSTDGTTHLCSAYTDEAGGFRCSAPQGAAASVLLNGYRGRFDGDAVYGASSDDAPPALP